MGKKWKLGMRALTVGDVDVWAGYKKALFTRNVKRATLLRKARINADLTQEEVAQGLDISGAAYNQWENGHRNLTMEIVNEAIKSMTRAIRKAA